RNYAVYMGLWDVKRHYAVAYDRLDGKPG
ncbi:unnamed protein product, partial [Rotaria sp. Silwood1]